MAGTIVVDRIESDASYASTINVAGQITFSNTVNFGATAQRITGDFSNDTLISRVMFQTNTVNGTTNIFALPNGTGVLSQFVASNNADPTNAGVTRLFINGTESRLEAGITGTGTYLPLTFRTNGSERMRIDTSGNVGIGTSSPATTNGAVTLNVELKSANNTVLGFETTNLQYGGTLEFRRTARTTQSRFAQITGAEDNSGNGLLYFYTAAAGSDVSENMRLDGSGNLKFNSGYGSAATAYGCRAWVNFNGTGVVAIRASGNVTSITDNGVGSYTVNFSNAMPDANYASCLNGSQQSGSSTNSGFATSINKQTSTFLLATRNGVNADQDQDSISVSIFR